MPSEPKHPIREVSAMTGVNPVTLRAWQRRYGLIQPARTEKGHRLYSDGDVEDIRHILHLLEQGVSIGQVKSLLTSDTPLQNNDNWATQRALLLDIAQQLQLERLDSALQELFSLYPTELLLRLVIEPWLQELATQARPDRELVQRSACLLLERCLHKILTIQTGPRLAVGSAGKIDHLYAALVQYELQGLECRSSYLGIVEPPQARLADSRLKVDGWVILLGAGLTESWFSEHHEQWPEATLFVGELGKVYQDNGWLIRPYAPTISDLAKQDHAPFNLV